MVNIFASSNTLTLTLRVFKFVIFFGSKKVELKP